MFINTRWIANEPEILHLEILNTITDIKVNDSLDVNLVGFTQMTMGERETIIRRK